MNIQTAKTADFMDYGALWLAPELVLFRAAAPLLRRFAHASSSVHLTIHLLKNDIFPKPAWQLHKCDVAFRKP